MLEEVDPSTYMEWRGLLDNLHSPEFHAQERMMQNRKVKLTFDRKRRYKEEAMRLEGELAATSDKLMALQKNMNETTNSMSKAINVLQEERTALVTAMEEGRCQIKEMNTKINDLRMEAARNEVKSQSLHSALGSANLLLTDRNRSIADLEIKLSQCKQDAVFAMNDANHARSSLEDVVAQLKACESKYSNRCSIFKQDLSDARSSNAVVNVKLEATQGSLDAALRSLEDCRRVIAQSNELKDIVQKGISKLDENISQSGFLLETSRDDLRLLLSHSKEINDKLSLASDAALDNATSIDRRLVQLQEVVSTLSSSTLLKTFSDEVQTGLLNVKRTLDDVADKEKSLLSEVQQQKSEVQHLSDDVHEIQAGLLSVKRTEDEMSDQVKGVISVLEQRKSEVQHLSDDVHEVQAGLSSVKRTEDDVSVQVKGVISEVQHLSGDVREVQAGLLSVKRTEDDVSAQVKGVISEFQQQKAEVQHLSDSVPSDMILKGQPEEAAAAGCDNISRRTSSEHSGTPNSIRAHELADNIISKALILRHHKMEGFDDA